jgi:hypothetical protein
MLASWLLAMGRQVTAAQSARTFSQSTEHHAIAPAAYGPLDATLIALGVVVVLVATLYSLLYLVRPGEPGADHIKRRILEDGREASP